MGELQMQQAEPKEPLRRFKQFNQVFETVPDEEELAHRYIATRMQCTNLSSRGSLIVKIISAKGLRNADATPFDGLLRSKVSDPYCVCTIPGREDCTLRTDVIYNCLDPAWHHEATIHPYIAGESVSFTVYDKDMIGDDDLLGKAWLSSNKFWPDGFEGDLELTETGVKVKKSTLKVKITAIQEEFQSFPNTFLA